MTAVLNASEQHVVLRGISWETYGRIVTERGDSSGSRLTYDCGTLEIMMPSLRHERLKETISTIFQLLAGEMDIDFSPAGSTTFRRQDLNKGFEPDSCFYIQHAAHVRGKEEIDLNIDPPPDLVIEIDVTRSSLNKLAIYAAINVPEVWRYAGDTLEILKLRNESYVAEAESTSLRGIAATMLNMLVRSSQEMERSHWMRQVREFVRKN